MGVSSLNQMTVEYLLKKLSIIEMRMSKKHDYSSASAALVADV